MHQHHGINYLEIPCRELEASKAFFAKVFGWTFTDYGPDYAAFDEGLDGGFAGGADPRVGAPLVILYARDLEAMLATVEETGGEIVQPIFSFPGGRRFHFRDPAGNEMAVWSDVGA